MPPRQRAQRCRLRLRHAESNVILLRPYKAKYLQQATRVRDTIFFSYQHGGASLLDFLNAQSDYRSGAIELRESWLALT